MYMIMIEIDDSLKNFLTYKFLSVGLKIYSGSSSKEVIRIIDSKGPGFIFLNIKQLNSPWLTFLAQLRQYKDERLAKLIILSGKDDTEFIQALLLLNVSSLISISLTKEEVYKRIYEVYQKNPKYHPDKREHVRMVPRKTDDMAMNISIPNVNVIMSTKVINISIGGVALQVANTSFFSEGMVIDSAQLRMGRKIGLTSIKIVMVKGNFIGARFVQSTDYFLNVLGKYILDRLTNG